MLIDAAAHFVINARRSDVASCLLPSHFQRTSTTPQVEFVSPNLFVCCEKLHTVRIEASIYILLSEGILVSCQRLATESQRHQYTAFRFGSPVVVADLAGRDLGHTSPRQVLLLCCAISTSTSTSATSKCPSIPRRLRTKALQKNKITSAAP